MMLNKLDFESGLKQDVTSFGGVGGPGVFQGQPQLSKQGLFGPTPNLLAGGYQPPNESFGGGQAIEGQGKSKRDQLWEQKRRQKQEIVNPPVAGGMSILDMMNPISRQKLVSSSNNKNEFQKAVSYEQPQPLMEIQPSQHSIQQSNSMSKQPQNDPMPQYQQPPGQQHSFQPPPQVQKRESNNVWNQLQQQQPPAASYNDPYFNQQAMLNSGAHTPPEENFQQYMPPPMEARALNFNQQYQDFTPPAKQQYLQNLPASLPSHQPQQQQYAQQQQQPPQQQQNPFGGQQEDKRGKQKDYLIQMQNEIKDKEEKKRREKEDKIRKEREELKKNMEYNPFGRAGAGAPIKDNQGNIVRKPGPTDAAQYNPQQRQAQPQQYTAAPQNYNQQFLPPQNMMAPNDVFVNPQMQMPSAYPYQQPQTIQMPMMYEPPQQQFQQQQYVSPVQNLPANNFQQQLPHAFSDFGQPPAQPKLRAPDPSMQFQAPGQNKKQDLDESAPNGGLGIGAYNDMDKVRQQSQKQELQNVLKQQMEEQKRRKDEEIRKKKEEEAREEERIRKERQKIEDEFKQEEMKKKQKMQKNQEDNAMLMQQKTAKVKNAEDDHLSNYVIEKNGQKADLFGKSPVIHSNKFDDDNPGFQRKSTFEGGPPNPVISQTRIIKEISSELKNDFKEEITKLRDEMNSQQRAFREQLERLKVDTVKSNNEKVEAMTEIERVKNEIRLQREAERVQQQQNLLYALNKYDPNKPVAPLDMLHNYDKPGSLPNKQPIDQIAPALGAPNSYQVPNMNGSFYGSNSQRRLGGSRQESREGQRRKDINNYEKMFFNNDALKKGGSQQREELKKPNYGIKEEKLVNFNQDYFQPASYEYNNQPKHEPRIMKRAESQVHNIDLGASLNAESTLLPYSAKSNAHPDQQPPSQYEARNQRNAGFNPTYNEPPKQQKAQFNPMYDDQPRKANFNPQYDEQPTYKPQHGPLYEENLKNKENKQTNGKPFDYLDHLQNIGAGDVRLNTEGEDTMDFVDRIVNGKNKPKGSSNGPGIKNDDRIADRLDNFNFDFPKIPEYEGIQTNLNYGHNQSQLPKNTYQPPTFQQPPIYQQPPIQSQPFREQPKLDIFSQGYSGGQGFSGLSENTLNSIGTLNSLNLDNLNQKNDDRIAKLGLAFDSLDMTQNTQANYVDRNYNYPSDKPNYNNQNQYQQQQQPKQNDVNDHLKQVDDVLFGILRSNDGGASTRDNGYNTRVNSSGGRIPHINNSNNYQNMQKMRDTRDQFMAPKMDQIYEDGGEDFEGTFKAKKGGQNYGGGIQLPSDFRRYDSLFDTQSLALD